VPPLSDAPCKKHLGPQQEAVAEPVDSRGQRDAPTAELILAPCVKTVIKQGAFVLLRP